MQPLLKELRVLGREGFHRLAYAEWGSPRTERTIVCAHGISRNARDFDVLAQALARRGARVVAPDLPGHGRSHWLADAAHYTDRAHMRAMAALIARLDVERVDWIGTSFGGFIGMLLAAQAAAPIRSLVLNDFGARVSALALRRIGERLGKTWRFASMIDVQAHLRSAHAGFGALTDEQWRHLAEYSAVPDGNGGFVFRYDPAIGRRFTIPLYLDVVLWHAWDRIECPVLVLRGRQSDLLGADTVRTMTQRGPGRAGIVEAVEIPGCGHAPALMDDAQIAHVERFLFGAARTSASSRREPARVPA